MADSIRMTHKNAAGLKILSLELHGGVKVDLANFAVFSTNKEHIAFRVSTN